MKENRHSQSIPVEVLRKLEKILTEANLLIKPYAVALTPSERMALPKMGEKTLSFVEKSHEFVTLNPNLCPAFLDQEAFAIDFNDAHGLWTIQNLARQFDEIVADTMMTAGSEAYQAALVFYSSVKTAASCDIPGAKAVYEELHKRFSQTRRRNSAD